MAKLFIYCDGGARGNPGPAAIGVVIRDEHNKLVETIAKKIGSATNNVAEYSAVIAALDWVLDFAEDMELEFYLDSELVVRQLNGEYKVKDLKLKELFLTVREKTTSLGREPIFSHISRKKNSEADKLVNQALDSE